MPDGSPVHFSYHLYGTIRLGRRQISCQRPLIAVKLTAFWDLSDTHFSDSQSRQQSATSAHSSSAYPARTPSPPPSPTKQIASQATGNVPFALHHSSAPAASAVSLGPWYFARKTRRIIGRGYAGLACNAVAVVVVCVNTVVLRRENRKADREGKILEATPGFRYTI
ncbi:hypothetical protein VC83_04756 [Pseudogymnoascus destructans]|uniref:Uncharacterized protein n=2 Tax=Pseudogymnoascus destructans TaxID=655981 RepID=L8FS35_PSED2|nr:uncharacterized protein VC83_04756 [Pseudogymnoascus destructans]ELR03790.1 hypothetical protein GMDG_01319 [Pseudogymnoascus destructans 20631-21]OAF57366.1 hypothetical protein VC83_04756 [Pseudogymnoascus destructans]